MEVEEGIRRCPEQQVMLSARDCKQFRYGQAHAHAHAQGRGEELRSLNASDFRIPSTQLQATEPFLRPHVQRALESGDIERKGRASTPFYFKGAVSGFLLLMH